MSSKEQNKLPISFWIDSSSNQNKHLNKSFSGVNPEYYFYGELNNVTCINLISGAVTYSNENCFNFLEEKLNEEKDNKDGVFIGYFSYNLFSQNLYEKQKKTYPDFFFAFFKTTNASLESNLVISEFKNYNLILNSNMSDKEYLEKVNKLKEEIKQGNVYQVNLTREYFCNIRDSQFSAIDLYFSLRNFAPASYSGYFITPFLSILSSSPEEFLYVDLKNGYIRTRPIKGTLEKDIFNIDEKNKAENTMIVDLERNDLGKICIPGSVQVKDFLKIEQSSSLNQVVSTIEGKLKKDIKIKDIFKAMFPGGSIIGAPKIAAMKLIDQFEPTARGAYTGCFGYIKTNKEMNFNILIRTIFIESYNEKHNISFNIGGGIVANSTPEGELKEIKLKAQGILKTLGVKI